ncbi:hypothetical protein PSI17_14755 [Xenorhabdus sp. IM139775]|nr:hypothetical protein [Xenorhabdus sp. IM139775]MDC9594827.1 hypothetical protein [Xenorhabdus sp. IM139775]
MLVISPSPVVTRLPLALTVLASLSSSPVIRSVMLPPARIWAPMPSDTSLSRVTVPVAERSRKLL